MSWLMCELESWNVGKRGHMVSSPIYAEGDWILAKEQISGSLIHFTKVNLDFERKVTLFDVCRSSEESGGHPCFVIDESSQWFQMSEVKSGLGQMIDLCSGLGGFSVGFSFFGVPTVAAIDHSELAVDSFQKAHGLRPFHADLMDDRVIPRLLHAQQGKLSVVTMGFPCQPHSLQGDQRGFDDVRAMVLPRDLFVAHLLQSRCLMLENVANAANTEVIQRMLTEYAQSHGLEFHQQVLNLQDSWPARRTRWFALLTPSSFGDLHLRPMPFLGYAKTSDVVEELPAWPFAQEHRLRWNTFEKPIYEDRLYQQESRTWDFTKAMPTALHSWGNALFACPCGCRSRGFGMDRLERSGLRGLRIESKWHDGFPRHPHGQEVAYMLGFPPFMELMEDQRANLCLLGNAVSPIQVIWLLAELQRQGVPVHSDHLGSCIPEQVLGQYCRLLQRQKDLVWPKGCDIIEGRTKSCHLLDGKDAKMIAFKPGANIGQLLDAEHELIGPGFRLQLHHECLAVPNHAFLQPITYVEEIVQKKQARAVGERKVRICLKQKDSAEIVMVDWGTQLFDVLSKIDLKLPFCCVQMPSQKIVSPGLRLLEDSTFFLEEFFVAQGKEEEHHDEWEYEPEREDEWLDDLPSEFGVLVKKVNEELKAAGKISVMTRYHGRGLDSLTIDIAGKAIIDLLPAQRKEHVWFLDPSLASDYMRDQPDIAEAAIRRYVQEAEPREIFVMCAIDQHWLTLQLRWSSEELFVVGANAQSEELSPAVMSFIDLFKKALEVNRVVTSVENMLYQQKDSMCGALALVHMANLAGLIPEISYQAAHDWYVTLRWGSHTFFRAEGDGKEEIQEWLRTFLPQKGVPESEVENRIQEAMAVIPVNALRKAKESTNPWRSMKVLTDKKGKTFRWVKEAELLKQVERKAESKYGVELQKKPKQPRNVTAEQQEPLRTDPNQIWLKKDGFVDSENKNVAQLMLYQWDQGQWERYCSHDGNRCQELHRWRALH